MTYEQLRAAGLTRKEVELRETAGWLIRRHTGVYAVGHVPHTRESRWMAGVLALGDGAVLSHRSAGALWEIVRGAVPTEVIVPTYNGHRKRDGILVHRENLQTEHVTTRDQIPVTSIVRTLLDLAAVLPLVPLGWAFDEAQVRHHLQPHQLAVEVLARRGYRGNGKLRYLLDGAVDPAAVRSILELRFLKLCATYGIPRPLVNEKIDGWTPDFIWPELRLIVETDGYDFHRTAAQRKRDELKDAFFVSRGFIVIRLTWADVVHSPAATANRILSVVRAAA